MAPPLPLLVEGEVVSSYTVVRLLGAGQCGEVYEAVGPRGSKVALKLLRQFGRPDPKVLERFRREAMLSTAVRHPNVVEVLDHGQHGAYAFLVMPLLSGTDMEARLERTGPLRPQVAVSLALDAAAGLAAVHAAGLIHRDFKPANLFLEEREGSVEAIVCDFGVAKTWGAEDALTTSGAVLGTPLYMAPEQFADSKHVDARCDVWAFGMTLYHALAGRPAFNGIRGLGDLLVAMKEERIPPLQSIAPWVRPDLARVIHAALLPLERRFDSLASMSEALERWGPDRIRPTLADLDPMSAAEMSPAPIAVSLPPRSAQTLLALTATAIDTTEPQQMEYLDPLIGRVLGGRYRILSPLGKGGMGVVYSAIDSSLAEGEAGRDVAVKVIHPPATEGAAVVRRFLREAGAARRVESENVTRVLDVGADEATNTSFMVMDLLRGRDLAAILREVGAIAPEAAVRIVLEACAGLKAVHALGIVHRDVKPSNLFVHETSEGAVVKVCDFGIAKQLEMEGAPEASAALTLSGGILGSPIYMSPEQARSARDVDARTDVYSLCLSLHEALTGQRPWPDRHTIGEIILAVCTEDVPSLRGLAPWVDPELARVVERGLARDREARIQSVTDLEAALRPFGLTEPLRRAHLALHPERRSSLPTRPTTEGEGGAAGGPSADLVSVASHAPRPPGLGGVRGYALGGMVVVGLSVAAIFTLRPSPTDTSRNLATEEAVQTTLPPASPAIPSATLSVGDAAPSSPASASSSPSRPARVDASAPPPRVPEIRPGASTSRARGAASGSPPSTATAAPPSPSFSVGRGVTATDLPP